MIIWIWLLALVMCLLALYIYLKDSRLVAMGLVAGFLLMSLGLGLWLEGLDYQTGFNSTIVTNSSIMGNNTNVLSQETNVLTYGKFGGLSDQDMVTYIIKYALFFAGFLLTCMVPYNWNVERKKKKKSSLERTNDDETE